MTHLLLCGNAYSQIIRNARGEIIALYPLMPDRMEVNRDANGQIYYEYYTSTDDAHTMKGSSVILQPSDVLHIPGLGFDGLVGYSPIAMAKNAIGMAIACEEYGAKFFANGAAPSGVLEHTKLSPNNSGQRTHKIDRISPHCVVSQCTAESLGEWFKKSSTQASSDYGIDKNGRVGMYVEEKNRSWCTSSGANDQRAVTIECASDNKEPFTMNDVVYERLIDLCTDICKRNGKTKLIWFGDKAKSLAYEPKDNEMIITVHRWFANKSCPGEWLYARLGDLAEKVTARLGGSEAKTEVNASVQTGGMTNADCPFVVKVSIADLNIRKGAGTNTAKTGKHTGVGTFTITEVRSGKGADKGWGKLKSGAGWISLDYCQRV